MTKSLKAAVLVALGLLVASGHVIRAQDALPNASDLLAKSAAAMGGLDAWKKTGLSVDVDTKQPMEIMRQVQISAGSLVVIGVLLGASLHPAFYALSAFVGAGLVVAGVTGFCGMARFLALMPWNRAAKA